MRIVAAIAGILVALPPLLFFWIGTQTFIRPQERALALGVTIGTGALLLSSVALLFTPSVQRLQGILILAVLVTLLAIVVRHKVLK